MNMTILAQETIRRDDTLFLIKYDNDKYAFGINIDECFKESLGLIGIPTTQIGTKDNVLKGLSEMIESDRNKLNQYIRKSLWEGLIEETKKEICALEQFKNIMEDIR